MDSNRAISNIDLLDVNGENQPFSEDQVTYEDANQINMSEASGNTVNKELIDFRKKQKTGTMLTPEEKDLEKAYSSILDNKELTPEQQQAELVLLVKKHKDALGAELRGDGSGKFKQDGNGETYKKIFDAGSYLNPIGYTKNAISGIGNMIERLQMTDQEKIDTDAANAVVQEQQSELLNTKQFGNAKYKLDKLRAKHKQGQALKDRYDREEKEFTSKLLKKYGKSEKIPVKTITKNAAIEATKLNKREKDLYRLKLKNISQSNLLSSTKLRLMTEAKSIYAEKQAEIKEFRALRAKAAEAASKAKTEQQKEDNKIAVAQMDNDSKEKISNEDNFTKRQTSKTYRSNPK